MRIHVLAPAYKDSTGTGVTMALVGVTMAPLSGVTMALVSLCTSPEDLISVGYRLAQVLYSELCHLI